MGSPHTISNDLFVLFVPDSPRGAYVYLRTTGVSPRRPRIMAVRADTPLTDDQMVRFAQLIGYAWRVHIRGKELPDPVRIDPNTFAVRLPIDTSRRTNVDDALGDFEDALSIYAHEGTPVRTSNKQGAGTQGTRLVEGLGEYMTFVLYYDDLQPAVEQTGA